MAAGSLVAKTNGVAHTQESQEVLEYRKIVRLRDEIFADNHPRIKIPLQSHKQDRTQVVDPVPSMPAFRALNGVNSPQTIHATNGNLKDSHVPVPQPMPVPDKSPNNQRISTIASGSSGIDPIFLTIPEVVVRAELQQKRRRIERSLEEQLNQKRVVSRQKTFDQDALPEFDITEVLKKAQELVKPFKPVENNGANRTASSSDSFDENTFYSSQMNESTTEEADDSAKFRPQKACRYFLDGNCRFGDTCTFSHDTAAKGKSQADGPQPMDIGNVNADEQANSRCKLTPPALPSSTDRNLSPASRIAQLEEELSNLKSQTGHALHDATNGNSRESRNMHDEPAYSPPDAGAVLSQHGGRAIIRASENRQITEPVERRTSTNVEKVNREYARRDHSPLSNEVRVIRNRITSPVAPQPARVSPLAVAKVPHIHQGSRVFGENRQSRISDEAVSARQSPYIHTQPPSSRKRRREIDSHDRVRNVVPRQGAASPQIRVKEEPVSPPPFSERAEIRQPRHRQDISRPIYVDSDNSRYRDREPIIQPRAVEQPPQGYFTTDRRPMTPIARRVISRNGHHVEVHEEQDLRRVVSARQVRLPQSPLEQLSVSQPSSARAASQVYIPKPASVSSRLPRASVQPPTSHLERDRSLSPLPRARFSPVRGSVAMAPPGRVVTDQHGHKYLEAPLTTDRQASVIPISRQNEFVPRYEQPIPRLASARDSHVVSLYDEEQYIHSGQSPLSPRYVEYQPAPAYRQVLDREGQIYNEALYIPRNENVRMIEYPGPRPTGHYEEIIRPHEGVLRTQSVRPNVRQYEAPCERITRIQSVRPEQDRVISLERRHDIPPQASRHVSVRADDRFSRPINYAGVERPKYEYAIETQDRRYVEDMNHDDGSTYEAAGSSGWRPL